MIASTNQSFRWLGGRGLWRTLPNTRCCCFRPIPCSDTYREYWFSLCRPAESPQSSPASNLGSLRLRATGLSGGISRRKWGWSTEVSPLTYAPSSSKHLRPHQESSLRRALYQKLGKWWKSRRPECQRVQAVALMSFRFWFALVLGRGTPRCRLRVLLDLWLVRKELRTATKWIPCGCPLQLTQRG